MPLYVYVIYLYTYIYIYKRTGISSVYNTYDILHVVYYKTGDDLSKILENGNKKNKNMKNIFQIYAIF